MIRGDKQRIAELAGLSKESVWNYFKGQRKPDPVFMDKLLRAMKQLGIKDVLHKKIERPRQRLDIYENLPHGAIYRISKHINRSHATVKRTILGKRLDKEGIIKLAELEAAINIWKTRFCKYKSQL